MDSQSPPPGSAPATIPLKRPHEDEHAPSVSSPLNPNAATRGSQREQRTKKESLKKRESTNPPLNAKSTGKGAKKVKEEETEGSFAPSPVRYAHQPTQAWQYTPKETLWISREPEPYMAQDGTELKKPLEIPENKKNFRYTPCAADQMFTHSRYYRQSDERPYGPRFNFSDCDRNFYFNSHHGCTVTNEKGWRMGRANLVAREGTYYYEVKIVNGVPPEDSPAALQAPTNSPLPHVRMGWSRREAPLDAPVGFDGYSYGLTDIRMEPMHKSRASKFVDDGIDPKPNKAKRSKKGASGKSGKDAGFSANDTARTGDVVGLSITLPPVSLHRKVADGTFNPAVDLNMLPTEKEEGAPNIVRDRYPVPYRGAMYFEALEYRATKGMEGYGDRGPFSKEEPSTNHADASLRTLPESSIKVWKNGKRIGAAFRNLMAFLPPASQPANEKGVRLGMDDGMVGYLPAVSAFSGAVAEVNFGPDFWYPLDELEREELVAEGTEEKALDKAESGALAEANALDGQDTDMPDAPAQGESAARKEQEKVAQGSMRGMGVRYTEQIAEDVVYDIIDEVDFFVQDGGRSELDEGKVKTEET